MDGTFPISSGIPQSAIRNPQSSIEWAFHFPAERDPELLAEVLRADGEGALGSTALTGPEVRPFLAEALPSILRGKRSPLARIYYGPEFCEHLLPSPERLRRVLAAALEAGSLPVTLLLPWATDAGLARIGPLLAVFEEKAGPGAEAVVNDWGVLRLLRREFPGLTPVLGRLMNKMMRDPRVAPFYSTGPAEARKALSGSSARLPAYQRFLLDAGVRRIELDPLLQGIDQDLDGTGLRSTLWLPFGYAASGRICVSGSLHLPRADRFRYDLPCRHECQEDSVELRNTRSPFAESRDLVLWRRGNTVFYPVLGKPLEDAIESIPRIGADRVVLELDLPM
jgi:hypothetical protein